MSYVTCRLGKLLAVRWTATPTRRDTDQLLTDTRTASEAAGGQLRLLAVIPIQEVDIPPAEVRARMQLLLPQLLANLHSIDAVFEGTGVKASLIRTLLRGMVLVSKLNFDYHFHANIQDALRRLEVKVALDPTRTLTALRASKIVP
ncbi:MAG TPA: hypothetical protein VG937_22700, partial [Polyangiaceae bacterium]|nr:hypothetical protein [Polyangiaceae bacterium]